MMTKMDMALFELLAKYDQGDLHRGVAEAVSQLIMEADVEGLCGAGRHERGGERTTCPNGCRERALDTRLGTLNLRVPKLRQGSYFPGFLDARKTSKQVPVAVMQEARIGDVSTQSIDELGTRNNLKFGGAVSIMLMSYQCFVSENRGYYGCPAGAAVGAERHFEEHSLKAVQEMGLSAPLVREPWRMT